ncbi:MAG: tetratricopeptide repeat protein [Ignavibacteriae bacterium]|nr:tetratricopeptide repeat protein [Ignavibacteriota bacterium]
MVREIVVMVTIVCVLMLSASGCSASKRTSDLSEPNTELALTHFLEGSLLDQKGDYAKAILEYQDALKYKKDPAIYHAIAKDYSLLGKHELAIQMGREAVRLAPANRTYQESLAGIYITAFDLGSAIKVYEEIIHIDSSYMVGWLNLARLYQLQKPNKAIELYEAVIDRFGPNADAYFQLVQLYSSMNKLDRATEALKGMLAFDPGNIEIKKALGDTYLRQGSVDTALKIYSELVELHPGNLEVRAAIAHAYLVKQDYEHAAEQFDIVLRKDTLSVEEQLRFGQIFTSFIEKDSAVVPYAVNLFERIRETYPDDWRPYWFLGAMSNIAKDDSGALENFKKVKELATSNPDGWVGMASVYYDRGNYDEAIAILTEAKNYVPDEFRVHFLLGVCYQRKHQPIDAASALEKALQLNTNHIDAISALALVYDEMKHYEDSDSLYERALRINAHYHLILNNYGYSLAERGIQLERALRMAKEAVEQQPENQSYLDTFGWVYYRLGRYEEAETYIRKAVELGSKSAVIHEHLGDVYFKMSKKDKALQYWQKALELDSSNQSLKEKIQRGSL